MATNRGVSPETKEMVRRRDEYNCRVCGRQAALSPEDIGEGERYYGGGLDLQVHHMTPKHAGGEDTPENLVTVCGRCHKKLHKHDKFGNSLGLRYRELFEVYSD